MPCYQSNEVPAGFSVSGSGVYQTEADCLNACKEGACCNGTTCSVKPQCQCECTTGSCCGPDIVTVSGSWGSMTGPACRNESKQACLDRGGTWRCGVNCTLEPGTLQELEQGLEALPCIQEGSGLPSSGQPEPVFKGIGTVCSPNPCDYCGCPSGISYPEHLIVEFSGFTFSLTGVDHEYNEPVNHNGSILNAPDMTGAEQYLADFLNGTPVVMNRQLGAVNGQVFGNFRLWYYAPGCDYYQGQCASCDPAFFSIGMPVPFGFSLYFPCSGGVGVPQYFMNFPRWQFQSIPDATGNCTPPMPRTDFSGGNSSYFTYFFRFNSQDPEREPLLSSPSRCDFSNPTIEDFVLPFSSLAATWVLPDTYDRLGNRGYYSGAGGTITVRVSNPLP